MVFLYPFLGGCYEIIYSNKRCGHDDSQLADYPRIIPFQNCVGEVDYAKKLQEIKNKFIPGISGYSDKCRDGRESLAEAFVKYRNGEDIPDEARKLIGKYILHWRRV